MRHEETTAIPAAWFERQPGPSRPLDGNLAPVEMFAFWTHGEKWISQVISRVTGCPWSHCGIGFVLEEGKTTKRVYFEALFSGGFQGPKPWNDVTDWKAANKERRLFSRELGTGPDMAMKKLSLCRQLVGIRSYFAWQLVCMYFFERFGWKVPRSDKKVVCSEIVGRVLYPEMDLRTEGRTFDEITPCSICQRIYAEMMTKKESRKNA